MASRKAAAAPPGRLSELVIEIRGTVSQVEAARRIGVNQPRISRAEHGTYTFDAEEADAFATTMGASAAQRRELLALCEAARANTITGKARLVRSAVAIQEKTRDLEAQSTAIRSWQPEIIPGALQTWDYTLAVIEREPSPSWTRARRERMALLEDRRRHFHQLLSEATLRWVLGSPAVMAEQVAHLAELSRRPNITIGVVAFGSPAPAPPSAFHLYGDRAAETGTDVGTTFLDERPDLEMYRALFDRLDRIALHGDEMRALLADVEARYRKH